MGNDGLACFELLATLLTTQAAGWFELFPHPPVTIMKHLHLLLAHHDQELGHFINQARRFLCYSVLFVSLFAAFTTTMKHFDADAP